MTDVPRATMRPSFRSIPDGLYASVSSGVATTARPVGWGRGGPHRGGKPPHPETGDARAAQRRSLVRQQTATSRRGERSQKHPRVSSHTPTHARPRGQRQRSSAGAAAQPPVPRHSDGGRREPRRGRGAARGPAHGRRPPHPLGALPPAHPGRGRPPPTPTGRAARGGRGAPPPQTRTTRRRRHVPRSSSTVSSSTKLTSGSHPLRMPRTAAPARRRRRRRRRRQWEHQSVGTSGAATRVCAQSVSARDSRGAPRAAPAPPTPTARACHKTNKDASGRGVTPRRTAPSPAAVASPTTSPGHPPPPVGGAVHVPWRPPDSLTITGWSTCLDRSRVPVWRVAGAPPPPPTWPPLGALWGHPHQRRGGRPGARTQGRSSQNRSATPRQRDREGYPRQPTQR